MSFSPLSIDKTVYLHNDRPEMRKLVPENAKYILEVGCSDGTFCNTLRRNDREVWGIEYNPITSKEAVGKCDKLLIGDFNELYEDLPKHYFDCVIFNDVLEHLYSPWDVVGMVKFLLSSEGVIISSIPNFRYISNLITEVLWEGEFRYRPEGGVMDDTHIRFFTSKSIIRMYKEQNYEIISHEGLRPCKSWKEKLFISLSLGLLKDARYKQFATVAKPKKNDEGK